MSFEPQGMFFFPLYSLLIMPAQFDMTQKQPTPTTFYHIFPLISMAQTVCQTCRLGLGMFLFVLFVFFITKFHPQLMMPHNMTQQQPTHTTSHLHHIHGVHIQIYTLTLSFFISHWTLLTVCLRTIISL